MSMFRILGKTSFHSSKKDKDFFVLHVATKKENVEGLAVDQKFVSPEIFSKVVINCDYTVRYGCNDFGQAFIEDLTEVPHN